MNRTQILFLTLVAGVLPERPAISQPVCTITQITDSAFASSLFPSLDDGSIAFNSNADLTGDNPTLAVFLWNGSETHRISNSTHGVSLFPSLDAGSIAFTSRGEIFLWNGSEIVQITDTDTNSESPSLDGDSIAFRSHADLTGENPRHGSQIYLYDGSTFTQITHTPDGVGSTDGLGAFNPSLDDGSIAFVSKADLTGENPDQLFSQIFLFDGSTITQVSDPTQSPHTHFIAPSLDGGSIAFLGRSTGGLPDQLYFFDGSSVKSLTSAWGSFRGLPSLDGGFVAFASDGDHTGENPDRNTEIFLSNTSTIWQLTNTTGSFSGDPSLDGSSLAFRSTADFTGGNPDRNREIFLASCKGLVPALPPGPYLTSDELPSFRFKVRITAGDAVFVGQREDDCVPETLCVSGALPGRSELFLRMIGPRPNGFLWTQLVRFTPSRVEVWAEQLSTGQVNYYDLPALPSADTELAGLVDKEAFPSRGAGQVPAAAIRHRPVGAPGVTPLASPLQSLDSPLLRSRSEPVTFASDAFPDYLFTVRIFSAGDEQPVQVEENCIPETICVSGALPGRSELFLRIIGPRPNGFLWTNLVRFTTSRVEVEIEQLATGETRVYVLDEVPRQSDQLPGRVDKEAFLP